MKGVDLVTNFFQELQNSLCEKLSSFETEVDFIRDQWERDSNSNIESGGGITKVLEGGNVFEKAGVNYSAVQGVLPDTMALTLGQKKQKHDFYATGVSLVFHPHSPLVPTTHANVRYLQVGDSEWFGGGMDLTPYYLFDEDAISFHQVLKDCCDLHNPNYYKAFKEKCDNYFYLPHRNETRGVGGIFFDYLGQNEQGLFEQYFPFIKDFGESIANAYFPIVERRHQLQFTSEQKDFQLIRRGRYVEFNLLYDRGTKFGLETGGRAESILMSMPPNVNWVYDYLPEADSPEEKLIQTLQNPKNWLSV